MRLTAAFHWIRVVIIGGLGLQLGSTFATAAGFAVPEVSALGTAMSNAVVANPEEKGAFAYNPAAMGFHDQSSVALGALFIGPDFGVDTATGSHDSGGADWVTVPMFQAAFRAHDQWRVGLGINAPLGLETRWKTGTFPKLSGEQPVTVAPGVTLPIPFGAHPTNSKLEIISLVPTLVYQVNPDLSIAAGLDYYKAESARLDSQLTSVKGDGDGWGWNASVLYRHGRLSFGAVYHSTATSDLKGRYKPLNSALASLGTLNPGSGLPPAQAVKLDLDLPWRLQLGARYEFTPDLAVEFDWTRTGWGEFDKLEIKSRATGTTLFSDANEWKDTDAYRLGLAYDVLPRTQLRFGYTFDETGQDRDHFSARVPDNDRHLFSLGLGQDLEQGWALDFGYMYVKFKNQNYRGSSTYTPVADLGKDVNGTDAIAGKYKASAHLFVFEVSKSF